MTTQTKTEQLADELENTPFLSTRYEAAAKMRRLEAANAELVEAVKDAAVLADFAECWITDPAIEGARRLKGRGDKYRALLAKHGGAA